MGDFRFDYKKITSNIPDRLKKKPDIKLPDRKKVHLKAPSLRRPSMKQISLNLNMIDIRMFFDRSNYGSVKNALHQIEGNLNQTREDLRFIRQQLNDMSKTEMDGEEIDEISKEDTEQSLNDQKQKLESIRNNLNEITERLEAPLTSVNQLAGIFDAYDVHVRIQSVIGVTASGFRRLKSLNVVGYVKKNFPTQEEHFGRNEFMPFSSLPQSPEEADALGWYNGVASNCHQFTCETHDNEKWVSPDGTKEVIYNSKGEIVTQAEDCGTFNYADPQTDPFGHLIKDVIPWVIYGNALEDSTNRRRRIKAFFGLY